MIDIHAHVLPGIDDGPKTIEEALALLEQAVSDGIHTIVSCPHFGNGLYSPRVEKILEIARSLQLKIKERSLALDLCIGMEIFFDLDILKWHNSGRILSINGGPYLCLELPSHNLPIYTAQVLFELRLKGYFPVLVHPERNLQVQSDPSKLSPLMDLGLLLAINSGSLTGRFGRRAYAAARYFLCEGMVSAICSDGHAAIGRPALLSEAVSEAGCLIGPNKAQELVSVNPRKILMGEPLAFL